MVNNYLSQLSSDGTIQNIEVRNNSIFYNYLKKLDNDGCDQDLYRERFYSKYALIDSSPEYQIPYKLNILVENIMPPLK